MKNKQTGTAGIILILIGVFFIGRIVFEWDFFFFKGWWTLIIIIPSILSLKNNGYSTGALIGLCAGILLFLSSIGIISMGTAFKLAIPIALIMWGCSILLKNKSSRRLLEDKNVSYRDGCPEYSAVFTQQKITCNDEIFAGATCNAIFGSVEVDLRGAYINEDVAMNCSAIFSGMVIRMPDNVNVRISCVPIFGGIDNRLIKRNIPGAPTLYINATCMFGGIDIK